MGTLSLFSEKERNYHEYQARMNYLKEAALQEIERLKALLGKMPE